MSGCHKMALMDRIRIGMGARRRLSSWMKYRWKSVPRSNIEPVVLKRNLMRKAPGPHLNTEGSFQLYKGLVAVVIA